MNKINEDQSQEGELIVFQLFFENEKMEHCFTILKEKEQKNTKNF
jgi:hypothetical protein